MIVKERKPIQFLNDCACNVDLGELENAINWYSAKPVVKRKIIFMHGRYPAVAIYKEKIHVHRLLMMFWMQRKLSTKEYVHHKNENRLDASKHNLELINASEHQSLHTKGRVFSVLHRQRIAEGNRRRAQRKHEHPHLLKGDEEHAQAT